ncbi:MAG TPA: [protein-PII] uridylyltransferase [Candidatus Saccharimonadia bacterium]|nr:[protein-PII] uridylyltransferase [Candidatus Saccharimonadia bacterium]
MKLPAPDRREHWWPTAAPVSATRERLAALDAKLADALWSGVPVGELVRARAWAVEQAVLDAWTAVADGRHPGASRDPATSGADRHWVPACAGMTPEWGATALVAVGGFGRGESFPHSDLDLLVLVEDEPDATQSRRIEEFFKRLWDDGLKPGHAVRTPQQCAIAAAGDITITTSMMEARLLDGAPALFEAMRAAIAPDAIWPPEAYAQAKLAEQAARHARHDDTSHNLEPNVKEGPGGLRDLQLASWLAQRQLGVHDVEGLAARGLLGAAELAALIAARDTLWRARFGLHAVSPRAEERLLFEHQRDLATRFGHADEHAQNLAVEQFMQGYYRAAAAVDRVTERLLQRLAELRHGETPHALDADFVAVDERLDLAKPGRLEREPVLLLRAFAKLADMPALKGFRPRLLAQLDELLPRLDPWLRASSEAGAAFLAILSHPGAVARVLSLMGRYGVLARLVPAFGRVAGRMQHDLFHVYTVDQHTLKVLRFIERFAHDAETFPLAHALLPRLRRRELLYLAALFHDIAKGRGGDHSVLGEQEARAFGTRLGLAAPETELVAWLVREHLTMSTTAQKQDIGDPAVVSRFAAHVGEQERLDYLYLLTVADINGTSPRLWNGFKDRLLSDLHGATRFQLARGLEHPVHASERIAQTRAEALELLARDGVDRDAVAALWASFADESFLRYSPEQLAWQTRAVLAHSRDAALVAVRSVGARATTEVLVHSPDRDGLFATITAVLDRLGLGVVEARVTNTRDGRALDTFEVLEADGGPVVSAARAREIEARLASALAAPTLDERPARRALTRRQRQFPIPTRLEFGQDAAGRTQLALTCADRPGLLAHVAQALRQSGVRVHGARIATFGERAEDFFVLSDAHDAPLDEPRLEALEAAIHRHVDGAGTTLTGGTERHAHG